MNLLFLVSLLILVIITVISNKGNVFSPPIMLLGGFVLCTIVLVAEQSNWNYQISFTTYVLITTSCIVYMIGDSIASRTKITLGKTGGSLYSERFYEGYFPVNPNLILVIFAILYTFVALVLQMRYFLRISALVGNSGGLMSAFSVGGLVRSFVTHESINRSAIETLFIKLALPISYISYFLFYINKTSKVKVKKNWLLVIPIVFYALSELFTTNRIGIINCVIYIMVSTICIMQTKRQWSHSAINRRVIKTVIVASILLFIVFRISGYATQRGLSRTMFDQISDYTGAAIVAFDIKVCNHDLNIIDASSLFSGIFRVTNGLGLTNITFVESNAGFVSWTNGSTNIYTALCAYISAIGYVGNYITFFLMGYLYRRGFQRIKETRNPSSIILFSWLIFAPTLSCIADRFYSQIFVLNVLIQIIEIQIILKYIIYKRMEYEDP